VATPCTHEVQLCLWCSFSTPKAWLIRILNNLCDLVLVKTGELPLSQLSELCGLFGSFFILFIVDNVVPVPWCTGAYQSSLCVGGPALCHLWTVEEDAVPSQQPPAPGTQHHAARWQQEQRHSPLFSMSLLLLFLSEVVSKVKDWSLAQCCGSGSVAFLTPGFGIRDGVKKSGMNNPDHISESLETIFWVWNA
jgi:hypothetical protein